MYLMETNDRILLRLVRGEEIVASLQEFVQDRQIPNAMLMGIGACEDLDLGVYDLDRREYIRRQFSGAHELLNLTGNVGWTEGRTTLQAQAMFSNQDFQTVGGHLFSATVYATVEITLWPGQAVLERVMDDEIGLKLWKLPHEAQSFGF